jgi:hypothetical protein
MKSPESFCAARGILYFTRTRLNSEKGPTLIFS